MEKFEFAVVVDKLEEYSDYVIFSAHKEVPHCRDVDGPEKVTMECLERLGPSCGIVSNKSIEWIMD